MQVSVIFSKSEPTLTNCATPVTVLSILYVSTLNTHITVSTGTLISDSPGLSEEEMRDHRKSRGGGTRDWTTLFPELAVSSDGPLTLRLQRAWTNLWAVSNL